MAFNKGMKMRERIIEILSDGLPHTLMDISSHFNGSIFKVSGKLMILELTGEIKQLSYNRELGTILGRTFEIIKGK